MQVRDWFGDVFYKEVTNDTLHNDNYVGTLIYVEDAYTEGCWHFRWLFFLLWRFICVSGLGSLSYRIRHIKTKEHMKSGIFAKSVAVGSLAIGFLALSGFAPAGDAPRKIDVVAKKFAYEPSEITVKKGEPVVLELTTADTAHGIKFKDLDLSARIDKGKTSELAFTPTKAGDFVGHCSVFCGLGHGSMTLTLHVTE